MDERRVAPFTPPEVDSLNDFQASAVWSPVLCPIERCGQKPIASEAGWACPERHFAQDSAPTWMTDGTWRNGGQILKQEA
jgi:hypothetical protein